MESCYLKVVGSDKKVHTLYVMKAASYSEKQRGLMYIKHLDRNAGMLFISFHEHYMSFWMKNTFIPLSIAYINKHGVILEIYQMIPLREDLIYYSKKPAQYALEVNKGWFLRNNIRPGDKILLDGCFRK